MQKEIIGTNIALAAKLLQSGEVVAIPTETVYGLAGNALNPEAVAKIFEVKNRPSFDPLIVHVHHANQWEKYAQQIPDKAQVLFEKIGPAPITYIFKKRSLIPDLVTSGHSTVGLRVPNHHMTLELLRQLDFPLAAPSANPFGYVSPTSASHVANQLGDKIPYILDGGASAIGLESTIIDFSQSTLTVLRLGGMSIEMLEDLLEEKIGQIKLSSSAPHAPGMLVSHYAPKKPFYLKSVEELKLAYPYSKIGALRFSAPDPSIPIEHQLVLSESGNLNEAARQLFAQLRNLEHLPVDIISGELVPQEGLGRAINDRLTRASNR